LQDKLPSQLDRGGVARVWRGMEKRKSGKVQGGHIALLTKLISCNLARSVGQKLQLAIVNCSLPTFVLPGTVFPLFLGQMENGWGWWRKIRT